MRGAAATVLFGAFDRHNLGDLLFAHVLAALLPERPLHFAGLVARDLRHLGGHAVAALPALATRLQRTPVNLIHAGGEVLTCRAGEAAVMLLAPEQALHKLARGDPVAPVSDQRIPYLAAQGLFTEARVAYNAVGGVDFGRLEPDARIEVVGKLREAHWRGVRDLATQAALQAAGVQARLMPDCAVLSAQLFGARIAAAARCGEVARMRSAFPHGYLAAQFSTEFGDDASLAVLAVQLDALARKHRLGVVLFRAGGAPWHDDLDVYRRLATRMHAPVRVFTSLQLWEICALIASSRACCGSSLHARILAASFGLPRATCVADAAQMASGKQQAYAATWDSAPFGAPLCTTPAALAQAVECALAAPPARLHEHARAQAERYRCDFAEMEQVLYP